MTRAFAIPQPDGRANPNQLLICEQNLPGLENLRRQLLEAHRQRFGSTDGLLVGLQLTHSGRFSRPENRRIQPLFLYHHPILDAQVGIEPDQPAMTDGEIESLVEDFLEAAAVAQRLGFDFVDVKHCHGYLGHEFLTARTRPGKYGDSFENRTRFLRQVVQVIHSQSPGMLVGVRLSLFDFPPFRLDATAGIARPSQYRDENGVPKERVGLASSFLALSRTLGIVIGVAFADMVIAFKGSVLSSDGRGPLLEGIQMSGNSS